VSEEYGIVAMRVVGMEIVHIEMMIRCGGYGGIILDA